MGTDVSQNSSRLGPAPAATRAACSAASSFGRGTDRGGSRSAWFRNGVGSCFPFNAARTTYTLLAEKLCATMFSRGTGAAALEACACAYPAYIADAAGSCSVTFAKQGDARTYVPLGLAVRGYSPRHAQTAHCGMRVSESERECD